MLCQYSTYDYHLHLEFFKYWNYIIMKIVAWMSLFDVTCKRTNRPLPSFYCKGNGHPFHNLDILFIFGHPFHKRRPFHNEHPLHSPFKWNFGHESIEINASGSLGFTHLHLIPSKILTIIISVKYTLVKINVTVVSLANSIRYLQSLLPPESDSLVSCPFAAKLIGNCT